MTPKVPQDIEELPPGQTHEVFNQPTPLEGYNAYRGDQALKEALHREGGGDFEERVAEFGAIAGGELMEIGFEANENPPVLRTHDRFGHRIDEVDFHPAYHRAMELGISAGITSLTWTEGKGARVARQALGYLAYQAEAGTQCPMTMTHAAIPALREQPEVAEKWEPLVLSGRYDRSFVPMEQKGGVTIGMAMTEKQGGSDVRANTTRAYPIGQRGPGEAYELVGHKWFCSAPMSDAFLTLAQSDGGLTCFLLPRWRPDGTLNRFHIQRLKDKLGNQSNASAEVEYHGAWALMVGEEGRGVATIIRMVGETRLDCVVGSAALMRQATSRAAQHCAGRSAFGTPLVEQPLMRNVLADLSLETEASVALGMRLSRAFEEAQSDAEAALFARIATAVGKYWVCKRAPLVANEAQECLGGAGYVEESILPRLYREAPLNAIWEGSGNVQCLDVLRAMSRNPETVDAFFNELASARGADENLDRFVAHLRDEFADQSNIEFRARRLVERMALALQGAVLVKAGNQAVADAFCASRLGDELGLMLGGLPSGVDVDELVDRARMT